MNRKRTFLDKLSDFVSGKGFYLAVLVCVAAIALSGFYLVRTVRGGLADLEEDLPAGGSAHITVTPAPVSTPKVTATPAPTPTAEATPEPTPESTPQATQTALVFTWPLDGTVITPFSVEVLSYDVTMGDWRTHGGIDIAADLGTQVKAAAEGVVSAVYEDDLMGTTVVVEHSGGLFTVYSNLEATPTVAVGDSVTSGSIVGCVGNTAPAESGLESHLHFAMYQDEQPVNPEDYLTQ